ncbi:molecular chaperone [Cronobacter sakazakii]|uniref:fimbrial biogenesis chaperone n=1 Tax=Cronobacter sakazakii TaxID=28141 RepID=UPI000BEA29F4|nr:molecular chaperone [Cronobacter sakazakii]ELY6230390.1 molecular chaperone [Cronobacter malonaticus]MEB8578100.1 molecular chaperone [Cronobacter sakazakii]NHV15885.1 molecular chaperone [Cronobacter sakazakii]PUV39510.1 molecular chaperone [Cronobacter sakazakii]TWR34629.1 molecular chaperone [Cronobacter sakazakii]
MFKKIILLASLLFIGNTSAAKEGGLGLDVSRVIFNETDSSVSFTAKNTSDNIVVLLKAWVEDYYNEKKETPFFITPPLTRLDPNNNVQYRINKLSDASSLPKDRESVFSINVMAIPPKKGNASVQFALNTRIKLFYRPEAINNIESIKGIQEKLTFSNSKQGVLVSNPTPYFATIKDVKLDGVSTKEPAYMVKPFSDLNIPSKSVKRVSFSLINDFGAVSDVRTVTIKP